MIYLGKKQTLRVTKTTDNGVYLSSDTAPISMAQVRADNSILNIEHVLLPKNQVPAGLSEGSEIEVFIYKDSEDRPIATTAIPKLMLGEVAKLTVKQVTQIGTFLDWGLLKDLFMPFKEQTYRPSEGDEVLVALYIDKSQRLCATMKIYEYLSKDSDYEREARVSGTVYEIINNFGAFVAVDDKYSGLIPNKELFTKLVPGQHIEARVVLVHEDGKLTLSMREKAYVQIDKDAQLILDELKTTSDGFLPYHDKSDAEEIKEHFSMSKNAFKRAIGHLMKEGVIDIKDNGIQLRI